MTKSAKAQPTKPIEIPHSKDSEMMVLGSMLTSTGSLHIGADGLSEADFYFDEHKIIFEVLKAAYRSDKPADVHLIGEELKRQSKLKAIGGISYLTTLAQYAGTSAYIEEYVEILKSKSILRKLIFTAKDIEKSALENPSDAHALVDKFREEFENISSNHASVLPIPSMESRLEALEAKLKTLRGRKYLGLCQKTIPEIDDKLLGLRKLILLAAAPNVGKTALTNQFAIDVLKNHPKACVVYFSLEMTAEDLLIRLLCNQSQLEYETFVLGSNRTDGELLGDAFFKKEEIQAITNAKDSLKGLEKRLQIVDKAMCPYLTSSNAIAHIETVKNQTGCSRAFVIIDYMQVWHLNPQIKFLNENEIDKWRIGEAMKIRDSLDGDPIIVISEARKPQGDSKWAGDMSDVMGAARMTYSPDAVLLFSQLNFDDISTLWVNEGKLVKYRKKSGNTKAVVTNETDIEKLCEFLENKGISLCRLDLPKGRDGMQKFSILLEFHYRKNILQPANFAKLKAGSKDYKPKNGTS